MHGWALRPTLVQKEGREDAGEASGGSTEEEIKSSGRLRRTETRALFLYEFFTGYSARISVLLSGSVTRRGRENRSLEIYITW